MNNIIILFFALIISFNCKAQTFTKDWFDAFKKDDVEFVKINVRNEAINDCFEVKGSLYNLLSIAIKLESEDILNYLIERKANLNKVCTAKTPAMYAVKYDRLEMLKTLIENGVDLSLTNDGKSVLDYARNYKKLKIEKFLLSLENK